VYNGEEDIMTPVYQKERFPIGVEVEGPCIIEGKTATIIVPTDFKVKHDIYGNLVMLH
ncbi:MAG: hypothetical protein ACOC1V_07005, partial [Candidatus Saliniplasma sp.]